MFHSFRSMTRPIAEGTLGLSFIAPCLEYKLPEFLTSVHPHQQTGFPQKREITGGIARQSTTTRTY
jgi:hypothetical protein